jgi:hypothetical protein
VAKGRPLNDGDRLEWPVQLRHGPVELRALRYRDARAWADLRRRNEDWLREWESTVPPSVLRRPLSFRQMVRRFSAQARAGEALPWAVTYDGKLAGQLNVSSIIWGSARMASAGYWVDPAQAGNIWVNLIHHWTKDDCDDYMAEQNIERNPVTKRICRSGECLCGTQQTMEELYEAQIVYPEWGEWRLTLERRVREAGFPWRMGEHINEQHVLEQHGQQRIDFSDFQPMCVDCNRNGAE